MPICDQTRPLSAEQEVDARLNAQDKLLADAVGLVVNSALSRFSELDKDGNGFLSEVELAGDENVRALSGTKVSSLSNDVWGPESRKGISLNDLSELQQMSRKVPDEMALARGIRETLSRHPNNSWLHGTRWVKDDLAWQLRTGKMDCHDNYYFGKAYERWGDVSIPSEAEEILGT